MAKKPSNNPHGYKVCYKEAGDKKYTRYFLTYTYRQATEIYTDRHTLSLHDALPISLAV